MVLREVSRMCEKKKGNGTPIRAGEVELREEIEGGSLGNLNENP